MRERAEGREGREIRVWVEGDRKREKTGRRGALLMRNSSLFQSTAGKFQRGTDKPECRNPVPTHPDDFNAYFLTSTLNGWRQVLHLSLPKLCFSSWRGRRDLFQNLAAVFPPFFVLSVFLLPSHTRLWMKSHTFYFKWEFFSRITERGSRARWISEIRLLWVKELLEKGRSHMLQSVAFHHFQTNLSWQELNIGWQEI